MSCHADGATDERSSSTTISSNVCAMPSRLSVKGRPTSVSDHQLRALVEEHLVGAPCLRGGFGDLFLEPVAE